MWWGRACLFLAGFCGFSAAAVNDYFAPPAIHMAKLSPDEQSVAAIRQHDGTPILSVAAVQGDRPLREVTLESGRPLWMFWLTNHSVLLSSVARDKERWQLVDLRSNTRRLVLLTDFGYASLLHVSNPEEPQLLVSLDEHGSGFPQVVQIDVLNGAQKVVVQNPGDVFHWVADGRGVVRAGLAFEQRPEQGYQYVLRSKDAATQQWRERYHWQLGEPAVLPLRFDRDGEKLWVRETLSRDTESISRFQLDSAQLKPLDTDISYDSHQLITDKNGKAAFVCRVTHLPTCEAVAQDWQRHQRILQNQYSKHTIYWHQIGARHAVVSMYSRHQPRLFLRYTFADQSLHLLGSQYPALTDSTITTTKPMTFTADDGLVFSGYLNTPENAESLLVWVHGGPWARDHAGFDPRVQFLNQQGIAVLKINFRGSKGFGRRFLMAGQRQWHAKMLSDIVLAAHSVQQQLDVSRVCVGGASFGGYAAVTLLKDRPRQFQCGISVAGVLDLVAQLDHYESLGDVRSAQEWRAMVGSDSDLAAHSPVTFADRIENSVLVAWGEADDRVSISQSQQFWAALPEDDRLQALAFPDAGHQHMPAQDWQELYEAIAKLVLPQRAPLHSNLIR